jgi:hypothetical protein
LYCLVSETAQVAKALACAVPLLGTIDAGSSRAKKSEVWCVGVGVANGLSGAEIVRMILDQTKTFKYLRRTPNVEGKVLVLKLNKVNKEVGAGFATCAIWLGAECNDDAAYQESQGWNPDIMDRYAVNRPYRAYPIQKVVTFEPIQVVHICLIGSQTHSRV